MIPTTKRNHVFRYAVVLQSFTILLPSPIPAVEPKPVLIANPGFEQQALRPGERSDRIDGWTQSTQSRFGSGVVHDGADHINVAKERHLWAFLHPGQMIGRTDSDMFDDQLVDRLFVGLTVSSIQDDTSNEVSLNVSLYAADSRLTWSNGTLISSGRIRDQTNDNRGDPNSYLDAYAVLKLHNQRARRTGSHYWLVLENTVAEAHSI